MREKPYLLRLYLKCNHKCKICMTSGHIKKAGPIHFGALINEVIKAKKDGYTNIDFGGAEPTLYPKLPELIRHINRLGLFTTMCTNGHLFSSEEFTRKMAALKLRGVKISFHSHRPEVFDFITGVPGSYERILRAAENIRRYMQAYPNRQYSRPLHLRTYIDMFHKHKLNLLLMNIVINKLNYKDLPDMVDFLYRRKIWLIKITQMGLSGDVYKHPELLVGLDKVQPYLRKAIALAKRRRMLYFLGTLPICMVESEAEHFIPLVDTATYLKLGYCRSCKHDNRCPGLGKASLMARYGKRLLEAKEIFPEGYFEHYFKAKDIAFIKKLDY